MKTGRRRFICAAGLLPLAGAGHAATRRVVVIGGGWGGLAAARHLRAWLPIWKWCWSTANRSSSPSP